MALILVAVEGLTLTPEGIVAPGSGTVTIVSVPSPKVFAEGRGVYKDPLQFTVAGASASGYIPGTVATVGIAEIPVSATKVLADGILVMRLFDFNPSVLMVGTTTAGVVQNFLEPWRITQTPQTTVLAQ